LTWNKSAPDTSQIISAKTELRKAARLVADCPYCTEGWHYVDPNNDSKGVTRCACWEQYCNAFEYLLNLDSKFFVEDAMTAFKPATLPESECVALSQIRELRDSIEKMATRKGVE
jgi:hypothetical protein